MSYYLLKKSPFPLEAMWVDGQQFLQWKYFTLIIDMIVDECRYIFYLSKKKKSPFFSFRGHVGWGAGALSSSPIDLQPTIKQPGESTALLLSWDKILLKVGDNFWLTIPLNLPLKFSLNQPLNQAPTNIKWARLVWLNETPTMSLEGPETAKTGTRGPQS